MDEDILNVIKQKWYDNDTYLNQAFVEDTASGYITFIYETLVIDFGMPMSEVTLEIAEDFYNDTMYVWIEAIREDEPLLN